MKLINDMNIMNRPFPMAYSALLMGLLFSPALVAQPEGRPGGVDREALRDPHRQDGLQAGQPKQEKTGGPSAKRNRPLERDDS